MAVTIAIQMRATIAARSGDWSTALGAAVDAAEQQLELGDVTGFGTSLALAEGAFSALGHHEAAALLRGTLDAMGLLTKPMHVRDWAILAQSAASLEALGDERLAELTEQGAALDNRAAVVYVRTEAEPFLA